MCIYTNQNIKRKNICRNHTHEHTTQTAHIFFIPQQAYSQRQDTLAIVLPLLLYRLGSVLQDEGAGSRSEHEEATSDVSTTYRQIGH